MEYRPYYLAREWARLGHRVTIAAASHSHVRTTNPKRPGMVSEQEIDGIRYLWLRTPSYEGNGLWRIANMLVFIVQLLVHRRLMSQACRDGFVIASSTYPLDAPVAHAIARSGNAKLIYEVHDLWPLSPIELGGMSKSHPFIQAMQWAEDYAYKHASIVFSLLPLAKSHMVEHGLDPAKFHYIPNGVDITEWETPECRLPEPHRTALMELKASGRFIIGYAGGHGLSNALNPILDAASRLTNTPISFVFVGQGPDKPELMRRASQLGLQNVCFLDPVPKAAIPAVLAHMDCLVISMRPCSLYRFGISPNKLMDYMMAARPIIQAIEAGNDMVAESQCGISVPPDDSDAIAAAAVQMMELQEAERAAMGRRAREYMQANHQYSYLAQKCLQIMAAQ